MTSGVPQGSVLGPTMFSLFINDICENLSDLDIKFKLFADDLKLYSCHNNDLSDDLQTALNRLTTWCKDWQLNLATEKCFLMRISYNRNIANLSDSPKYILDNKVLNVCKNAKDVGVIIDNKLNFDEHISLIVRKATTRARLILKSFKSRDQNNLIKAYLTYVRPLLEYCSPVWSPYKKYQINKLESVQRFFTKRIPHMYNIPYEERLNLLGLNSLQIRRTMYDLSFCYKLINGHTRSTLADILKINRVNRTRGHDLRIVYLKFSQDITKYMFCNRVIKIWNSTQ